MTTRAQALEARCPAPPQDMNARDMNAGDVNAGYEALARALLPRLRERLAYGNAHECLDPATVAEMKAAGFFNMLKPKAFGGPECDPRSFFGVQIVLGEADMSASWLQGNMGILPFHLALFDPQAQADVWDDNPDALMASSNMPGGRAAPEPGGFRLSGRWRFSSGIHFADWLILGVLVAGKDGDAPEPRAFLVPRKDVEIISDWAVMGLRGTGSHALRIDNRFVPAHRTHRHADRAAGTNPGYRINSDPLYRLPLPQLQFRAVSSSAIGGLQGMLDAFIRHNTDRTSMLGQKIAQDPTARLLCAETLAAIAEMKSTLDHSFTQMRACVAAARPIPRRDRQIYRLQATMVSERCFMLAEQLFRASGAAALAQSSPFAQFLADIQAARQHAGNQYEVHGRMLGAALLGEEPDDPLL